MKAVEVRQVAGGWQAIVTIDGQDVLWAGPQPSAHTALHAMLDVLEELGWEPERESRRP